AAGGITQLTGDVTAGPGSGSQAATIAASSVTSAKMAAGAALANIGAGNITLGYLAASSVDSSKIVDGTITNADLAVGTAVGNLAAGSITSSHILDGTIASADIAASTITSGNLAAGAAAGNLTAGQITTTMLATDAVTTAKILDGEITNSDINAGAAIAWSKISKATSSIADLATRSASDLNSGTLSDTLLSANVVRTNTNNTYPNNMNNTFNNTVTFQNTNAIGIVPVIVQGMGGQTGNLVEFRNSSGSVLSSIAPDGSLKLYEAPGLSDSMSIRANAATTGSYVLTLPPDDGTPGQVLSTDGAGNLSWTTSGGGGVTGGGSLNQIAVWNGASSLTSDPDLFFDGIKMGLGTNAPTANFTLKGVGGSDNLMRLYPAAGPTGNLLEWTNDSGTVIGRIEADGSMSFSPTSLPRIKGSTTDDMASKGLIDISHNPISWTGSFDYQAGAAIRVRNQSNIGTQAGLVALNESTTGNNAAIMVINRSTVASTAGLAVMNDTNTVADSVGIMGENNSPGDNTSAANFMNNSIGAYSSALSIQNQSGAGDNSYAMYVSNSANAAGGDDSGAINVSNNSSGTDTYGIRVYNNSASASSKAFEIINSSVGTGLNVFSQNSSGLAMKVIGETGGIPNIAEWYENSGTSLLRYSMRKDGTSVSSTDVVTYSNMTAANTGMVLKAGDSMTGPLTLNGAVTGLTVTANAVFNNDIKLAGMIRNVDNTPIGRAEVSPGSVTSWGYGAGFNGTNALYVGYYAGNTASGGSGNSAIGAYAGSGLANGSNNTFLGYTSGTVITSGSNNVFIGSSATALNFNDADAVAIGYQSQATTGSIALGSQSAALSSGYFVAGSSAAPINNIYFGKGITDASPPLNVSIRGTNSSGFNIDGSAIQLVGGTASSGTSKGGHVKLLAGVGTATAGSGGEITFHTTNDNTAQALRMVIKPDGKIGINQPSPTDLLHITGGNARFDNAVTVYGSLTSFGPSYFWQPVILQAQQTVQFQDFDDSNWTKIRAANNVTSNYFISLPPSPPTTGQVLQVINGSGDTQWTNISSEGPFTPTYVGSTVAGSCTYSVQQGKYSQIGKTVHFSLRIQTSGCTGSGNPRVSLGVLPNGTTSHQQAVTIYVGSGGTHNVTTSGNTIGHGVIPPGVNYVDVMEMRPNGTTTYSQLASYDVSSDLTVSGSYITD
ncbi:MAG: hypothetical protein IT289_08830, partial [Oligoflexia bacterium]|nr:hypothetical protein [Oligoflexia bacterium]